MSTHRESRRGVALFAALALTAIIGLLIGGLVASGRWARRAVMSAQADAQLTAAADFALMSIIAEHRTRRLADLPLGRAGVFADVAAGDGSIEATVSATRLPHNVLWLVGEARPRAQSSGMRRMNLVARWRVVRPIPDAPIVARGNVRLGSSVSVQVDSTGDADCRAESLGVQVMVGGDAVVTSADSLRVRHAPTADDSSSYFLAPSQRSLLEGAPNVVHVAHDTTIAGGGFDGVLLVDGNIAITGSFIGSGLIVARGVIDAHDGNMTFTGTLMSFAPRDDARFAVDIGAGTVRFARCEIAHTMRRIAPLRVVRARGWAEMF